MGRALYKIRDTTNRNNFLEYLEKNREKVLLDLRVHYKSLDNVSGDVLAEEKVKEFISFWENISSALYLRDTKPSLIWEDATELLYMLPPKRIDTIKISLRATLYRAKHKNKSQLTIDKDVHCELSSFASEQGLTLSAAIAALLAGDRSFITADEAEDSENLWLPNVTHK